MRLNEILKEKQLDEAPQGFLSRMKDRAKSFVPGTTGDKAKGNLEVGKEANWLKKQFNIHLGKIGKDATPQIVIDFLRKNNYPTGDAEQEMSKMTAGAKDANAKKNAQQTAQNNTQTPTDKQNPAQNQPQGNPDNDLAIKGGKKKIPLPSDNKQVANQSIDWSEANFISENAAVTLTDKQLDSVFMTAVRNAIARDEGGQADAGTGVAPQNAQQGGAQGGTQAASDVSQGAEVPPEIQKQIATLRTGDKQKLLKML